MFKLGYKVNGEVKEVEFDSYAKILLFVATNRIKDEDFVSIDLGCKKIEGIDNLYSEVASIAQEQIDWEEIMDDEEFYEEELEA